MADFSASSTGLADPNTRSASFVRRGVTDDSTAQAVEAVGGAAIALGRGKVLADLEGELSSGSAATADPSLREEIQQTGTVTADLTNNLSKLAQARRSGLSIDQTNARAATLIKQAKASALGSLFVADIDKAAADFFGTGSSGGILALTPEERGVEAAREERAKGITQIQQSTGNDPATSAGVYDKLVNQARLVEEAKNIQALRSLDTQEATATTQAMTFAAQAEIQGQILQRAQSGGGTLSPEDKQEMLNVISVTENQLGSQIAGLGVIDPAASNVIAANAMAALRTMVTDNAALSLATENSSLLDKNANIKLWRNFEFIMLLGKTNPELLKIYTDTVNNPQLAGVLAKDPVLKTMFAEFGDFIKSANSAAAVIAKPPAPTKTHTPEETAGLAALLSQKGGAKLYDVMEKEDVSKALRSVVNMAPNTVTALASPEWQRTAAQNPDKWVPALETTVASLAAKAHMNSMTASGGLISDVQIDQVVIGPSGKPLAIGDTIMTGFPPRPRKVDQSFLNLRLSQQAREGKVRVNSTTAMGDNANINIQTMYQLASAYPVLWQEQYGNPTEYVQAQLFGGTPAAPEEVDSDPTFDTLRSDPELEGFSDEEIREAMEG